MCSDTPEIDVGHHTVARILLTQQNPAHRAMSTADRLIEKGKAEGRAKGKAEQLLLLLHKRFGAAAEPFAARVRSATPADLDRWALAVLHAATIDGVFRRS